MRKPRVYWRALRREWRRNGWEPTDTGWLLTLSLFVLILKVGLLQDDGVTKFDQFVSLRPSEMGDTIAGLFSALAFIWIIVTVFIQSRELRETRVEVKQQREATQEMSRTMAAQAKIFEGEQRERDEVRAQKLLDEMLRTFVISVSESRERGLIWHFSVDVIDDEFGSNDEVLSASIGERSYEDLRIDEAITVIRRRLHGMYEYLWELMHQSFDYRLPIKSEHIPQLLDQVGDIVAIKSHLSLSQQERLNRMRFSEIVSKLKELDETSEFWKAHS